MFVPLLVALFFASSANSLPAPVREIGDCPELAVDATRVRIGLPDGRNVVARRTQAEASTRGFTWVGRVEGGVDGLASFAVVDEELSGTLRLADEVFELRGELGGRCAIDAVDPMQFASCTVAAPVPSPTTGAAIATPPPPGWSLATASTIDVLVVYTSQARAAQGGTSAMEALIDLSLAEANQSYENSGVLQRVRLVARAELTGYTQAPSILTDLSRLTIPTDGFIDNVHALRDACGADAVCMLIQSNASCGASNQFSFQGPAFAPYAMCVVARSCAASNLSVAHELGHLMGLVHDRDTSTKKCSRASIVGYETQVLGASSEPSASITGSTIAFTSAATTLVPGDTNGFTDVFVRDRGLLTTARANVSSAGLQANAPAVGAPSVGGGRFVAFASGATNLAAADTNGVTDVFVRDLQTGTTDRLLPAGGLQADGECRDPSFASGERWLVFTSWAPNLGAGPTTPQVYRWDRLTNTIVLVSAAAGGAPGNGASGGARVADDGRVAFWSAASDLVAGDGNGTIDVFLRDVAAGTTTRVSLSTSGAEIAGPCEALCALSADGRRIAFATASPDVVAGDANGATDLFVRDRVASTTVLVSVNGLGATASGPSNGGFAPSLSNDGRYVAFQSHATDLVAGDTNNASDVFLRDLTAGTTERVSVSSSGAQIAGGAGEGAPVAISGYANHVVFVSRFAVELADTNGVNDVYVFDRQEPYPPGHSTYAYGYRTPNNAWRTIMAYAPGTRVPYFSNPGVAWQGQALGIASPSPFAAEAWRTLNDTAATVAGFRGEVTSAYCLGDGSGTPCPCGNASASEQRAGCMNSLGLAGRLVALGGASISADSLTLWGSGMPDSSALFFQGTTQQSGGAGALFGDGLRCAAGNVRRLAIRMNTSGSSSLPSSGSPQLSIVGGISAPTTAYYQVWYRNSAAFCSPSTFNLTNGLSVAWRP